MTRPVEPVADLTNEVNTVHGSIVLTPVRVQSANAVRAGLAERGIDEQDVKDAIAWARKRGV